MELSTVFEMELATELLMAFETGLSLDLATEFELEL